MGLTLRFDDRALDDLRQIRSYIAERSPSGAERVRRHIMHTIDSLADFPFLGKATDEPRVRILAILGVLFRGEGSGGHPPCPSCGARAH